MTPIDQYIYKQSQHLSEVLDFLNVYILALDPKVKSTIKWKVPYYTRNQSLCYLNVTKKKTVELNFLKGYKFDPDIKRYLEFGKRTMVGGISMRSLEDIEVQILERVFAEALLLDE